MGVQIGGRPEGALDNRTVQVGHDHVLGAELVVLNPRGLDDDQALFAVDSGGVAKGVQHEAAADEFKIRFEDGFAELGQEHVPEDNRPGCRVGCVGGILSGGVRPAGLWDSRVGVYGGCDRGQLVVRL